MSEQKPTIRILSHLARSGGTLISKCLGSMDGVVMLSEVHPLGLRQINPIPQAVNWFGLLDQNDLAAFRERAQAGGVAFDEVIALLHERAEAKGCTLVIREWTHIDYHGVPFANPTMRPMMAEMLSDRFRVVRTATVRHPVDQWMSLRRLPIIQGKLGVPQYLKGCAAFAEDAQRVGFVRYEDFTREPDEHLRVLCERLELPFDPGYAQRWPDYTTITGDTQGSRGGTREIRPLTPREAPDAVMRQFRADANYPIVLERSGYEPDAALDAGDAAGD